MLIGDLLARRAATSPHVPFWQEGERSLSYGQLNADANRVARALLAAGVRPGDAAAVCAGNSTAYATLHFGCAKAGVVLAHVNARGALPELVSQTARSGAVLLAGGAAQLALLEAARPQLPQVRHWLCLDPAPGQALPDWAQPWAAWMGAQTPEEPFFPHGVVLEPQQALQMLFTSGTTGEPKAALISHRAKWRQGITHALNLGLQPGHRILSSLPLYHQYAQWLVLACAPLAGATVVAQPSFDPGAVWQALGQQGITHLPAVPTTLYRLLDHRFLNHGGGRAPHLRQVVYGAAPMDAARIAQLRARLPGVRLFQGFGQTETGYCLGLHDADHDSHPDSLGTPDVFSEVRLLDEGGQPVAPGQVGEIVARTPYLMNAYQGDPAATAEYFAYGPDWGRTGDLAWQDSAGYFYLAGRRKDLVISGGENIYPAQVERVLLTHPAVAEAAVLGVPDAEWGEALHAALVLKPGQALDAAALEAHCRAQLAGFKVPRRFSQHEIFPRTASGKVQKHLLRPKILNPQDR